MARAESQIAELRKNESSDIDQAVLLLIAGSSFPYLLDLAVNIFFGGIGIKHFLRAKTKGQFDGLDLVLNISKVQN